MKWVILIICLTAANLGLLIALTLEPPWQGVVLAGTLILVVAGVANLFEVK